MRKLLQDWIELVRSLGAALLDVYRAEAEELGDEVKTSFLHLAWAVGFFVVAGMIGFWTLAAGIYFLIHLLALWLPLWGAAGVVLLALVLGILLLVGLGWRRLQRWENPTEVFRRRFVEHRVWLEQRLLPPEERGGGNPGPGSEDGGDGTEDRSQIDDEGQREEEGRG